MPDNLIAKDLGPVSGYAVAVAHGYQGTEAQWVAEVTSNTQNAQIATQMATQASQSATNASQSATAAAGSATTATQKANEAASSATAAAGSATSASNSATTATQQATAASGSATAAAGSASAAAADRATVQNLKNTFENTTVPNAVAQVNTAGSTQVAAVEAKGQEVLDSIPEDYTALVDEVDTLSETKADSNGTYDSLTAGSAEQLLSSDGVEDKVPYVFRQTGGGAEGVGKRVDEEIVGGTIAWNQGFDNVSALNNGSGNGLTWSVDNTNHTITINGTSTGRQNMINFTSTTSLPIVKDHIYIANNHNITIHSSWDLTFSQGNGVDWCIAKCTRTATGQSCVGECMSADVTYDNVTFHPMIFDLTKMFGPAIADHIYSVWDTNRAAAIALFRSLFPADYYAYNSGELLSVNAASHETVGFNLWDEEWELGTYSVSGEKSPSASYVRCKNFIPVLPNTEYYWETPTYTGRICYYDSNQVFIEWTNSFGKSVFTTPSNCRYLTFFTASTTYNHNICVNLSDLARNGEYAPYAAHTYPLDSSLTLRGIPKLDSNNKLCYDGDIYKADGTVTRRYGVVDLGTLTWARYTAGVNPVFQATIDNHRVYSAGNVVGAINLKYPVGNNASDRTNLAAVLPDKTCSWITGAAGAFLIRDDAYTDAATFKAAMSGVYLVYELATPTTETAEPYQQIQSVDPLGTEEYVDAAVLAGTRDVSVPVGHNSLYMTDLRKKIENIPGDFSTLLAPIEAGFKATKAYAVNEFLIVSSQLYKVTASIANGATITPGTNVTATTVGDVLKALLS